MSESTLQPHMQRVEDERTELNGRLNKLLAFLSCPTFKTLPQIDQLLLIDQVYFMQAYSNVLGQRVVRAAKQREDRL